MNFPCRRLVLRYHDTEILRYWDTKMAVFCIAFLVFQYLSIFVPPVFASDKLYFIHTDHLGSTVAITDENGEVVSQNRHFPYGEDRPPTTDHQPLTTERSYTSQIKDNETSLYYYNARYYDPALGVFVSADSANDHINRYVYTANNPLRFVDPSGNRVAPPDVRVGRNSGDISVMVVVYNPSGVTHVHNPATLAEDLSKSLSVATRGNIDFNIEKYVSLSGGTPKTKKTLPGFDYSGFVETLGIEALYESGEIDEVWVFGTSEGRMWESWHYEGQIPIMGFNTEREVGCALHSVAHRFDSSHHGGWGEDTIYAEEFREWSGVSYGDPRFFVGKDQKRIYQERVSRARGPFAFLNPSIEGMGNVHLPPNAMQDYDYSNPIPAGIQGFSTHGCELWGCSQQGYLEWWMQQMPSEWYFEVLGRE